MGVEAKLVLIQGPTRCTSSLAACAASVLTISLEPGSRGSLSDNGLFQMLLGAKGRGIEMVLSRATTERLPAAESTAPLHATRQNMHAMTAEHLPREGIAPSRPRSGPPRGQA